MNIPKNFAPEDNREKLFDEMLEKNSKREAKLESIEDLVLDYFPEQICAKAYNEFMKPRYVRTFNEIDMELDTLNIGLKDMPELAWIKQIHVTNIDVGFYKLNIFVIESKSKEELEYYYEGIFNHGEAVNKEGKHDKIKNLVKDKYLVLLSVPYDGLRLTPVLLDKFYDYYKNKFDMQTINVRKVVELI